MEVTFVISRRDLGLIPEHCQAFVEQKFDLSARWQGDTGCLWIYPNSKEDNLICESSFLALDCFIKHATHTLSVFKPYLDCSAQLYDWTISLTFSYNVVIDFNNGLIRMLSFGSLVVAPRGQACSRRSTTSWNTCWGVARISRCIRTDAERWNFSSSSCSC